MESFKEKVKELFNNASESLKELEKVGITTTGTKIHYSDECLDKMTKDMDVNFVDGKFVIDPQE